MFIVFQNDLQFTRQKGKDWLWAKLATTEYLN